MKFMVGLQFGNSKFIQCIKENKAYISEVYFSWGDFANGRSSQILKEGFTPWELQALQQQVLSELAEEGLKFNLLLNANCYGKDSLSRDFYNKIGMTVDYIQEQYGLQSVTTTSPIIAKFLKDNFEDLEIRASVNMEIGTVQGMEYLKAYFDSYYMKRELNRDFNAIENLHQWCTFNDKKMYMLANSGCLNYCSAHNFHDNLVAHETEIAKMDNAYTFTGLCKQYLAKSEHFKSLIKDTNFIRPEDIYKYDTYFDGVKLATRINRNPCQVLNSYVRARYSGNILELLEPAHHIYPYVIENGEPLKIVNIEEGKYVNE